MKFFSFRRLLAIAIAIVATYSAAAPALAGKVEFATGELETKTVPDKQPGQRWVWVNDFMGGLYARVRLYDIDKEELLGGVDTGWEGIRLEFPRKGDKIYQAPMYMSRGFRGDRTDVVEVIDKHTLKVEKEIPIPPKAIRGWPDPNHTSMSDDDRFMFLQFFTPASSIGVVDLIAGKYQGEIETTGCAHVMAAGRDRFFTLCGDGSILTVKVDGEGKEVSRKRYPGFFDVEHDPLHGSGMRDGNVWYFTSWNGVIHPVDVSGDEFKPLPTWSVGAKIGLQDWVPGPILQPFTVHAATQQLYVLMHPKDGTVKGGGTDYHRMPGTEVWVYDIASRKREKRIKLTAPGFVVAVSSDKSPLVYVTNLEDPLMRIYDSQTGKQVKTLKVGSMPTLAQPVN